MERKASGSEIEKMGFGRVDFLLKYSVVSPRAPISVALTHLLKIQVNLAQTQQPPSRDSQHVLLLISLAPSSPLTCLSRAIYILSSIFSWRKTLLFPAFTRNGIPQKTFITILIGLLKAGTGKVSHCEAFKPLFSGFLITPHYLLPARLDSSFQILPDLISPLGGMAQCTSQSN